MWAVKQSVFVVVIILTASIVQIVGATTFFVDDNNCSDSYAGSTDKPWCTISYAVSAVASGDEIIIKNGTYHETVSTSKANLTFTGESKEGVVWSGMYEPVGNLTWMKTAGYTSVYQANATEIVSSGTVTNLIDQNRRGMYQEKSSIAEVDETPGTHYTSEGIFYIRTPEDASPANYTLWFSTDSWTDIIYYTAGDLKISNITFVGSTQYGVWVRTTAADIGNVTVSNCGFYGGGLSVTTTDSNVGGDVQIRSCDILYTISPVYDTDYPVHFDEDGNSHTYSGGALSFGHTANVTIIGSKIQFQRTAISFDYGYRLTVDGCMITDTVVHPGEFGHPTNKSRYEFRNSIFSMHGSTIYTPGSHITSEANNGYSYHFYNNVFYPGETNKRIFNPTETPLNPDYIDEVEVYFYNNLVVHDYLTLAMNIPYSNIHMDNNYYANGLGGDIIRYQGVSRTLSEWQTDTNLSNNSTYVVSIDTTRLIVTDEKDTLNSSFGMILSDSPVIDQAKPLFSPNEDYFGTIRPQGQGYDIGVHEYTPSAGRCSEVDISHDDIVSNQELQDYIVLWKHGEVSISDIFIALDENKIGC